MLVILLFIVLFQCYACSKITACGNTTARSVVAFGDSLTANAAFDDWYSSNSTKIDIASIHGHTSNHTGRYCNGPVWIEYVSALLDNADLYDFAQAGASINDTLYKLLEVPDLTQQVELYLSSDATLFVNDFFYHFIYIGGINVDIIYQNASLTVEEKDAQLDELVATFENEIEALAKSGVRYLLIFGVQPLQDQPGDADLDQTSRAGLGEFIISYNTKLQNTIENIMSTAIYGDAFNVAYFDIYKTYRDLLAPDILASNFNKTCNSELSECEGFIWWDSYHPITAIQGQIAQLVYDYLHDLRWL